MNIVPRNEWAGDIRPNGTPSPIPTPAPRLWLHHGAAGSSTIATARGYTRFHIGLGWQDIGYSFLIAEGKVLEGRGAGRQGSHTRGDNRESHGIVVCGDYTRSDPSQRDLDALRWLLHFGYARGWWPSPKFTGGHRDAPGASTSCPGDRLHRLIPTINAEPKPDLDEEDDMIVRGDSGRTVRYLIARLNEWRDVTGQGRIPDGNTVTGTVEHVITEFQQTAGLDVTGEWGPADWTALTLGFVRHGAGPGWFDRVGEDGAAAIRANLKVGGGLSQADGRYAAKDHTHTVRFE